MDGKSTDPDAPRKSIRDLLPDKIAVETTPGTLYVRHAYVSDLGEFKPGDAAAAGAAAVKRLTSRNSDKGGDDVLSDEDFAALNADDLSKLAAAIAKASEWGLENDSSSLHSLGRAAIEGAEDYRKQQREFLERMRTSIGSSYDFLKGSTLDRLKDQVSDLAKLRSSMPGQEIGEALRRSRTGTDAVREALAAVESPLGNAWERPRTSLPFDIASIHIPRPEETPVGRATVQSAEHVRLMAARMEALTELMAGLNQTIVTEVLPAWFKQVKEQQEQAEHEQEQAKVALVQAGHSLKWTKWAVIASVVVTVATAAWQVWVATSMDRDNGAVQREAQGQLLQHLKAQQDLLKEQLLLQQNSARRQAEDAEALRSQLQQLAPARSAARSASSKAP